MNAFELPVFCSHSVVANRAVVMRKFDCYHSRRRAAWVFGIGLLFISTVGVRCFAIGENTQHNSKLRPHTTVGPPPTTGPPAYPLNRRSRIFFATGLFATKDQDDENQTPDSDSQEKKFNTTNTNHITAVPDSVPPIGNWPCFDALDKELIRISLPVIGNYAINPMIGAVDLFWVNRMGNALAVAGQAAANQVFSSAFWFTSFLPSGKIFVHSFIHLCFDHDIFSII